MPEFRVDMWWADQFSGHFYIDAETKDEAWEKAKAIAEACESGRESPLDFVEENIHRAWDGTISVAFDVVPVKEAPM